MTDKCNGVGKYTYVNGDTYEGDWENNLRHGHGVYTFAATGVQVICQEHIIYKSIQLSIAIVDMALSVKISSLCPS